ncbi:hypothetical protein CEXT_514321 [Caerostris extrusa]|uniref:Uncharacterized protein n=1 Tax=Caerostris extrusa TaxID=172846 RepID=A0AAV4XEQ8_CAEEX|nr:hypothetical protein CEXT_514321 [Caerostris extrusa]
MKKKVIDSSIKREQVPPRFELGSLDSKSRVLTITPWNHICLLHLKASPSFVHVPLPFLPELSKLSST